MAEIKWNILVEEATAKLDSMNLDPIYQDRLKFEIAEIEKQGAQPTWVGYYKNKKRFESNPNNLLIPWLLGMVDVDPMLNRPSAILNTVKAAKVFEFKSLNGFIPHDLVKDSDSPDIDVDCLPAARDPIKEYAISKYGHNSDDGIGSVCSVGTWQTYKFKQALVDTALALGLITGLRTVKNKKGETTEVSTNSSLMNRYEFEKKYSSLLPDDVDQLKDGGKATCKGKVINSETGEEKDCGCSHTGIVCPKCGSPETDGPTISQLIKEHQILQQMEKDFPAGKFPDKIKNGVVIPGGDRPALITSAVELIGRVRNMGMHAGAIIITDRPLYGNIPLSKSGKKGFWVSMWTEGRNTQLSKFGYIKWDILGLKTLEYIFKCSKLIEENRGITFGKNMSGWDDIDPSQRRAGHYFDRDGNKHFINLDDSHVLQLANEQKTDGIFQFDTDLAKSILANGVKCFEDLLFFNAAGHPGPMVSIPEAMKNRDDKKGLWRKRLADIHPILLEILQDTYGIILWQEQLASIWQRLGGFTSPEAQDARKAVAKKWTHKLKPIGDKWLRGASPTIGKENAEKLWESMVSFGRYAFNRSHGISYCLVAHRCLWLKAHFAPEWWAAVMSDCHPDKLVRYMGVARAEAWIPTDITNSGKFKSDDDTNSVKFGTLNIDNLTVDFTVTGNTVNQGLIGVKGIGDKAARGFQGKGSYTDIDHFVSVEGHQSKKPMERFIKLGAFQHLPDHENSLALWMWYQYKYCSSGKKISELKNDIRKKLLAAEGWTEAKIANQINTLIAEYRKQYPKRGKIPPKINNWRPKPKDARSNVMALFKNDYTKEEKLAFQKEYLGYWIDSPMDTYKCSGTRNIAKAKELAKSTGESQVIDGIIADATLATTKKNTPYLKLIIDDGIQKALVFVWQNELNNQDLDNVVQEGAGVAIPVDYDDKRGTFCVSRGQVIRKLMPRNYTLRGHGET